MKNQNSPLYPTLWVGAIFGALFVGMLAAGMVGYFMRLFFGASDEAVSEAGLAIFLAVAPLIGFMFITMVLDWGEQTR